jgi:hypothetical protein
MRPMVVVMRTRMPSAPYHARIAAYGEGLPMYVQADGGVAGCPPQLDLFFIDVRKAEADNPGNATASTWWRFLMAHEAMQVAQARSGTPMTDGPRGAAYAKDPREREAFQEGLNVANS